MKTIFEFKVYKKRNGTKGHAAIVKDKNGGTLSNFLFADAYAFEDWFLLGIDDVLEGKQEVYEINANACRLEVTFVKGY